MDFKTFLNHFDTIAQAPNGIPKLRSLILDLAVRGKLVPQNPEDEPALFAIQAASKQKEEAVRLSKLKQSDLAKIEETQDITSQLQLPSGWVWTCLSNITAPERNSVKRGPFGSAIKKSFFVPQGYKVYEQKHAIYKNFALGEYYIDQTKFEELKDFEVLPGDIIVSCSGTVGELAIAPPNIQRGIINQALLKLTLNETVITNNFFLILFRAYLMKTEVLNELQGTAQKNITSVKVLKTIPFPLPSLAEQKRIVEKVDELMALCDRLQQSQETRDNLRQKLRASAIDSLMNAETDEELKQSWAIVRDNWHTLSQKPEDVGDLRRSVLQLAVRGKLVPQKLFEEPASTLIKQIQIAKRELVKQGKIKKTKALERTPEAYASYSTPDGWELVWIDDISDIGTGSTPLTSNPDYYEDGSIPWITSTTTSQDFIYKADTYVTELAVKDHRLRLYSPGSLIVALYGQGKTRGQISELKISATINQACAAITLIEKAHEHKKYIRYVFEKKYEELRALAAGGAQPNLNVGKIKETLIPLPPLEEQKRIVARVDELMQMCDRLEESLRQSQQRAEALAASAISHLTF